MGFVVRKVAALSFLAGSLLEEPAIGLVLRLLIVLTFALPFGSLRLGFSLSFRLGNCFPGFYQSGGRRMVRPNVIICTFLTCALSATFPMFPILKACTGRSGLFSIFRPVDLSLALTLASGIGVWIGSGRHEFWMSIDPFERRRVLFFVALTLPPLEFSLPTAFTSRGGKVE